MSRRLSKLLDFVEAWPFKKGRYQVSYFVDQRDTRALVNLDFPVHDEPDDRHLPKVSLPAGCAPFTTADREEFQRLEHELGATTKRINERPKGKLADRSREELERSQASLGQQLRPYKVKEEEGKLHQRVLPCLVRAGVRHPGLRTEDLRDLHHEARNEHHIELFSDLNALTTGLLQQVVASLGRRVSRVVVASSSVDVLHEYQGLSRRSLEDRFDHAEMARALHVLEEIREHAPVHVHQLAPGSARYFSRRNADGRRPDGDIEERTYISEDRQMIAAYWNYLAQGNPRVPLRLVTSDLALARVCRAERVPFLFARTPQEEWRCRVEDSQPFALQTLFWDPYALRLRLCTAHAVLWELCRIFKRVRVSYEEPQAEAGDSFQLLYAPHRHLPTEPISIDLVQIESAESSPPKPADSANPSPPESLERATTPGGVRQKGAALATRSAPKKLEGVSWEKVAMAAVGAMAVGAALAGSSTRALEGKLRVTLPSLVKVLPIRSNQRITLQSADIQDPEQSRQLAIIGELTNLFAVQMKAHTGIVVAGSNLSALLDALKKGDYQTVNTLFRAVPQYDKVLQETSQGAPFPSSQAAGAVTGWAITLGAAYKSAEGVLFGLADVSTEEFSASVAAAYQTIGGGAPGVPLPRVLDLVCRTLRLSPIRFEILLGQCIGHGVLRNYQAQRATVNERIPDHPVLTFPDPTTPGSYIRTMQPGRGVILGGQLRGSLVRGEG